MKRPNLNDKKAVDRFIERADPALRDALERGEAESFLAQHKREYGFDLANRRDLLGVIPFVDFELCNLPKEIQRQIDALPADWQKQPATHDKAEAINTAIEKHYVLPTAFYASLDDLRHVWIRLRDW